MTDAMPPMMAANELFNQLQSLRDLLRLEIERLEREAEEGWMTIRRVDIAARLKTILETRT